MRKEYKLSLISKNMPEYLRKPETYIASSLIVLFGAAISILTYASSWESKQPIMPISEAVIKTIDPYSNHNDLHRTSRGNRVYIEGENRPIDFPENVWNANIDSTVQEKDTTTMAVRESFSYWRLLEDQLDGLFISNNK